MQEMSIRNYSERTIKSYISSLSKLCQYYNSSADTITTDQVKSYIYKRVQDEGIAPSTINQIISIWRILQVDILKRKYNTIDIKRPRREVKIPQILSREEVLKLVRRPRNIKHRAILTLLYSTGVRQNELLSLKVSDIDSKRMVLHVRLAKGNKSRQLPISPELLALLRDYYKMFRPNTFLFEGRSDLGTQKYSAKSVASIIKKNARLVGITKNVYPHILRHCFATHLIEAGTHIKLVQDLLGHSSIKSTMAYLRMAKFEYSKVPNLLCDEDK